MRPLFALVFTSLVLLAGTASGQLLGISQGFVSGPDSVWHNSTHTYGVAVENLDSLSFAGSITVNYGYNLGAAVVAVGTTTLNNVSLQPGDTAHANVNISFTSQAGYDPGGNIVVIWPESPPGSTADSAFYPVWVRGQTDSLGIFPDAAGAYNPVIFQDNNPFPYLMRNTGTTPWSEPLTIDVHFNFWDSGSGTMGPQIHVQTGINAGLQPPMQDTTWFNFLDYAQVAAQGDGGNTIVIWPQAPPSHPQLRITDSAFVSILIAPVGLPEEEELLDRKLFPNPATDVVHVWVSGEQKTAHTLVVTDLQGKLVETLYNTDRVNLSDYTRGVYFINVQYHDGLNKSFKIIRL